jgi:hypothetical protein
MTIDDPEQEHDLEEVQRFAAALCRAETEQEVQRLRIRADADEAVDANDGKLSELTIQLDKNYSVHRIVEVVWEIRYQGSLVSVEHGVYDVLQYLKSLRLGALSEVTDEEIAEVERILFKLAK